MANGVLVLNADFRAMTVFSVPKAFLLVFLDKAEVIEKTDSSFLRTISHTYSTPSVIRLRKYVNMPFKGVMLSRQNIFKRDNHQCMYCGSRKELTLDHVIPRSRGGNSGWLNLVTACHTCNSRKGNRTPEEAGLTFNQKPYKPSFLIFLRDYTKNADAKWLPYLN
ncbi:MAG: HNH endonuclease [Cytophagales bacterium]|nr:MAG: HNH endonuclease [Cytophagales bacterium]TAF60500.1 MAG: HNH endonuclease [Cytophagales bacterium]